MMNMTTNQKMKRSLGRAVRGAMVAMLLVSYLPVNLLGASPLATAVTGDPAAAPVISKNIDHTSLYIQSDATYQRGVREYVTAASPDGGVLTYAWFINKTDAYLDGTDNATTGTFGDNDAGDGNSDYIGSYGSQSASSNILIATTPTEVGKYYTYVEITNTLENGDSQTIRSKRTTLDVRENLYQNKVTQGTKPANNKVIPDHMIFPPHNEDSQADGNKMNYRTSKEYLDSTLFYLKTVVGPPIGVYAVNDVNEAQYQMEGGSLWNNSYDLFTVGNSSKFEDISTIPGKIYEYSFNHFTGDTGKTDKDFISFTVTKSKLAASDYASTIVNRYWDGTDNISATDDKDNGNQTFKFDTAYMSSGGSTNYGVFPYGMNARAQSTTSTTKDIHFMMDIWNAEFGTDYFHDVARHILFPDTFDYTTKPAGQSAYAWQKALYDSAGVPAGLAANDIAASKLSDPTAPVNSNFLARINALNKANQFAATTYGGDYIQWFLSNDGTVQPGRKDGNVNQKSGYVTIPETQGATVLGFTSLSSTSLVNDNYLRDVVFKPISRPNISLSQSYGGDNSLTVTTKADYAYALIDVSFGYSQLLPNVGQYTTDAKIDPSLGKGNNWFTTTNSKITFTGLAQGATYRIIAIPKAAIQLETASNVTPLDVIDTDAWVDTTIGIADDEGQVLAGTYKNAAGETKGRVMLRQASTINDYALLAVDGNGRPITDTPVAVWTAPNAVGELEFDELDLLTGDNHYVVITKPQAFFHFDYAKATYSPTEVYRTGDTIPPGFALDDPVMVGVPVTITHKQGYQALGISELARTLGTATDADNNAATGHPDD